DRPYLQTHIAGNGNGGGEIVLAFRIFVADPAQNAERVTPGRRDKPAIAEVNFALLRRGVALFADRRKLVPSQQRPAITLWIRRPEPEHRDGSNICQRFAQFRKSLRTHQRRIAEYDENIVGAARDRLA